MSGAAAESDWPVHPWIAEAAREVRFGIVAGPRSEWPALREFVAWLEETACDSYWLSDHPTRNVDPFANLSALAATTRRLRLGTIVSCIYYRGPVMLARLAADVDRISDGRLILGLGIGDEPGEFAQMDLRLASVSERQAALAETVEVVRGVWSDEPFTFAGAHVRVEAASVRPGPVQRPRVPLLIAGGGERVTLRQVAQYADLSNFGPHHTIGSAFTVEDVRRKVAALASHCLERGRPLESVLRTHSTMPLILADTQAALERKLAGMDRPARHLPGSSTIAGTPEDVIPYYRGLVEAGLRYFIAWIVGDDRETVRLFAERVLPALGGS